MQELQAADDSVNRVGSLHTVRCRRWPNATCRHLEVLGQIAGQEKTTHIWLVENSGAHLGRAFTKPGSGTSLSQDYGKTNADVEGWLAVHVGSCGGE